MEENIPKEHCPCCGEPEIPRPHPRTFYKCGSSDYDQRPNTFKQTAVCRQMRSEADNVKPPAKGEED